MVAMLYCFIMFSHFVHSWIRNDIAPASGLAVIEIDVPSGYVILNGGPRRRIIKGVLPNLHRQIFQKSAVTFYLENVSQLALVVNN
jgi:hypothetical protein